MDDLEFWIRRELDLQKMDSIELMAKHQVTLEQIKDWLGNIYMLIISFIILRVIIFFIKSYRNEDKRNVVGQQIKLLNEILKELKEKNKE
jgi:hypothetical protein